MDLNEQVTFGLDGSLNVTDTHKQCYESIGQMLSFTETLPKLILRKYHKLICLLEASHAKTLAMQERARESRQAQGLGYGKSISEPFAKFDPSSYSWRMFQCSLTEDLISFSATWPRSGTMRNGIAYQLPVSAPLTEETESSSWPTISTKGYTHAAEGMIGIFRRKVEKGELTEQEAETMMAASLRPPRMKLWRTPTAEGDGGKRGLGRASVQETLDKNRTVTLTRMVRDVEMNRWPTPVAQEGGESKDPSARGKKLHLEVQRWPTPRASSAHGASKNEVMKGNPKGRLETEVIVQALYPTPSASAGMRGGSGARKRIEKLSLQVNLSEEEERSFINGIGQLNPTWVEWLMGFPLEYTELDALEMQSFRRSFKSSESKSMTIKLSNGNTISTDKAENKLKAYTNKDITDTDEDLRL